MLAMGQHTMSTNLDFDAFGRLREKRTGDFLWFRRAGKTYLVEDPATLRQAQEFFAPLRALEPEQEALGRRQEELSEKEQELDREQDELEGRMDRLTDEDGDTEDDGDTEFVVSQETTPPTEEQRAEIERELDELRGQQETPAPPPAGARGQGSRARRGRAVARRARGEARARGGREALEAHRLRHPERRRQARVESLGDPSSERPRNTAARTSPPQSQPPT